MKRLEHQFDDHEPGDQYPFRRGKRIGEQLIYVFLGKADCWMTFYLQNLALKSHKFDKFVKAVGEVGLRLNVGNTVILTNEAQQPSTRRIVSS